MLKNLIFAWDDQDGPWGSAKKPKSTRKPQQSRGQRRPEDIDMPEVDLSEVIRFAREKFGGSNFGGSRGKGGGGFNPFQGGRPFGIIISVILGLWLLSGFYIVAPDQQGVVLRFGQYVQTTNPGLHWHLPSPIERVEKPQVTRENVVEVGFRQGGADVSALFGTRSGNNTNVRSISEEALMLTGDENIVDLAFTVRWRIGDPRDFLFNVANVETTIKDVAESVMREVIGRRPIDDALTGNKDEIQTAAKDLMQSVLDSYSAGVLISGVELQQVNPPTQVVDAFRDVQAARADAEKAVNEATGYANNILPRARGQAAQILQDAEGYKASKVAEAEGAAQRFTDQLAAYRTAPTVTKQRLYLETMQDVVGSSEKIIIPSGAGGNILPYLPLGRQQQGGQ